ncbi:hypothetical protein AVEN_154614-1, partial [Araneus ventricosus]
MQRNWTSHTLVNTIAGLIRVNHLTALPMYP